jgi:hypothetical protein
MVPSVILAVSACAAGAANAAGANAAAPATAPVNTVATRNDFLIGHCPSSSSDPLVPEADADG